MIARRAVIGGGVVASLFAPDGVGQQIPERALDDMIAALKDIRRSIEAQQDFHDIAPVRARIVEFLRAQMKFPDFMDVGTDPWLAVYDWHVRNVQPIALGRDGNGRHTMLFMQTMLVLRPDLVPNYIGTPYDNR